LIILFKYIYLNLCFTKIGQQLIQLPDGKLHVTSYINQTSTPRTVQLTKNAILANNNNFPKTGAQVRFKYFIDVLMNNNNPYDLYSYLMLCSHF